ncbi:recombinase family protein [Streptomyces noursei]|uniref:recombinase family protein n=1 Tax=Streptomyces noursei TaxID=1971 RepID=UPI00381B4B8F
MSQTIVRVVGCGRQSVTRTEEDNSLSIGTQKRDLQYWADTPGQSRIIVGWALDTNTSGTTNPFQREKLGPWLTERMEEWDVLAFPRIDRISRKVRYFSELLDWVEDNNKHIVTVDGSLNTQAAGGSAVAKVLSVLAEEEHKKIRKNVIGGMRTLRELGRFTGGPQPFGYLSIDAGDEHRKLTPDHEYAEILRDIAKRVRNGESTYAIADHYNKSGVMVWSDYLRKLREKPVRDVRWKPATIARIIQNPVCVGFQTHNGEIWETEEGEPSVIADEPILKLGEWEATVKALAGRTREKKVRRRETACLLTGIAVCGHCGSRMVCHHVTKTLKSGNVKTYCDYECTSKNSATKCPSPARMQEAQLETYFEEFFMSALGSAQELVKMVDPGEDHSAELEQKRERLSRLESDYAEGEYDTEVKKASYWRTLENLTSKIAELEAKPIRPRSVTYQPTGRTWEDKWKAMGQTERRDFLAERSVTVLVWSKVVPGFKNGMLVHFGNMRELALAAGVEAAKEPHWEEIAVNVPPFWVDPNILEAEGFRDILLKDYGSLEIPQTLLELRENTKEALG